MGYYDDHDENRNKRKKGHASYFLTGLGGAIIGALLILLVFPGSGILNDENNDTSTQKSTSNQPSRQAQQSLAVDVTSAVTDAVDKSSDAVVGITNIQETNFWGQGKNADDSSAEAGTGSGVVYKKDGGKAYIVTNNHVIEGANELEVTLSDGTKLPAKLQGSDPWTDLAVIVVNGDKIKTIAEFGKSEKLKPGEPVIAIGNPLGLQFSGSITQGIISGLERTIEVDINEDGQVDWNAEVIQTDAAINPGNSGGALVNMSGQVIGINSMKIAENAVEGIGLSIPIDSVIPIINDIEEFGEVKRAFLGVNLASVEEISQYHQQNTLKLPKKVTAGVAITGVQSNSPASKAGLKEFDVIVGMDNEEIHDVVELRKYLYNEKKIGDKVKIIYYRDGKKESAEVTLSNSEI
ncbi:PDZ domain-containing protein [Peribacillus muralis]|uniref:S1C family serine protease n=1 Tax=Peribacillus muralis TaxID=264697 RepID=UPI001F4E6483|nr:trypsin-like peptidase domain-containing protein [Peribacillus muralis]MCK1994692.1 trypsin-like peptidase domain-containing protein [Peribacillus muralis]MCK2015073.1 trypsin-like peptidase domain-containing protein [Peribacillus muralis]